MLIRLTLILIVAASLSACTAERALVRHGDLQPIEHQLVAHQEQLAHFVEERERVWESLERVYAAQNELLIHVLEARHEREVARQRREAARAAAAAKAAAETAPREEGGEPAADALAGEAAGSNGEAKAVDGKRIVGGVEPVYLSPPDLVLPARIDTGAATASLDARDISPFERDGERWVRFNLVHPETEQVIELERKVVRYARVVQSSAAEGERRPVVELVLTLGDVTQTAEFTLTDRSHLEFPLLIGRNVLRDLMVVDVGRSNTVQPVLPEPLSVLKAPAP